MHAARSGLLVVGLLSLVGCGDDESFSDASTAEPDAAGDAAGCPPRWDVATDSASSSATITGGALVLSATDIADDSVVEVTQTGLTGDFDVQFDFTGFDAAAPGAFLQAGISEDVALPAQKVTAAIGTFPTVGVSAADQPGGPTDIQATALVAGSLRFERAGTSVTATATTADQTATITTTLTTPTLQVGVQVGSNMGTVAGTTTVSVTAFTVTGAGVSADSFDCDSLID